MDDEELTRLLKAHDEQALSEIIRKYSPLVAAIVRNMSRGLFSQQDIEECCSDVFYKLWVNAEKVQIGTMKGYLCAIAKSKTKDILRGIKAVDSDDISEISIADEFSLYEHLDNQQLQTDLAEAFDQFENPDREILIRYYYYYQTASEIAEKTGLHKEAVKSRIRRARQKLKTFLRERGYYYENQ